jgi:Fe-S-cluster containining protein
MIEAAQIAESEAGRTCGTCTLCCRLPEIDALSKPADTWCRHCTEGLGCAIYDERPKLCRDFLCLWMTDAGMAETWQPLRSRMLVYKQGPQLTVLVDPDHAGAWKAEPYFSELQNFAEAAEACGEYVILFAGDEVVKIEPAASAIIIEPA